MKDLRYISDIEERHGLNEAIYLFEQRLEAGAEDKETRIRLLFLYWFMEHEPALITNDKGERNWKECFVRLLGSSKGLENDADFNWAVGYLLTQFSSLPELKQRGEEMLAKAVDLAPQQVLPRLALLEIKHCEEVLPPLGAEEQIKLDAWGMLGDYFWQVLVNRPK